MKKIGTLIALFLLSLAAPAAAEGEYEPLLAADGVEEAHDQDCWDGVIFH